MTVSHHDTSEEQQYNQELLQAVVQLVLDALHGHRQPLDRTTGVLPGRQLPGSGNTGNGYTPAPHDHDDRYYTEDESDDRFVLKAGDTMTGGLTAPFGVDLDGSFLTQAAGITVGTALVPIAGIDSSGGVYGTNITATPTAHAIPKARSDGTLDPGWGVSGGGGGQLPAAHASTHATGGTDPISPFSIGAATPADIATHAAVVATTSQLGHSKPDGTSIIIDGDGTLHANRPTTILMVTPGDQTHKTWFNQPATVAEIFDTTNHRLFIELASFTQARLQVRIPNPGITASKLRAQYSSDGGINWNYLDDSSGPEVALNPATTSLRVGSWVTLSAGARTGDVLLRLVGLGGDGVDDLEIGHIWLQFK